MRLFIALLLFNSIFCTNINLDINTAEQLTKSEVSDNEQQKLLLAINLIVKTKIGKELKPYINELAQQGKIQLVNLQTGHYGESGEGCVVKAGEFYYEGLFILLSNTLSTEELASSLVHEVSHYRMIKELIELGVKNQTKVSVLEIFAFAAQNEFITELEQLKLADRYTMFSSESKTVSDIMRSAYRVQNKWSEAAYDEVFKLLVDYGYPKAELSRTISQRSEKECIGLVE